MIHINVSKNKKGQKQFRVVEVSDKNGKAIGAETKLNSKQAAWKNIFAKMEIYRTPESVIVQDNTGKKQLVYTLFKNGSKYEIGRVPQTIKK